MDVSKLKIAATTAIHLKDASGELLYDGEKPVRIHVYGPGSEQYARVEVRQTQRYLKRKQDNDGIATTPSPDEQTAEIAEDLADVTVDFENLTYGNLTGRSLFEAVYGDRSLGFIANQVMKSARDWGKFKVASATA